MPDNQDNQTATMRVQPIQVKPLHNIWSEVPLDSPEACKKCIEDHMAEAVPRDDLIRIDLDVTGRGTYTMFLDSYDYCRRVLACVLKDTFEWDFQRLGVADFGIGQEGQSVFIKFKNGITLSADASEQKLLFKILDAMQHGRVKFLMEENTNEEEAQ